MNYINPFLAVLAISCLSFIGILTLALKQSVIKRFTFILVSLAVGVMLGDVFFHILPSLNLANSLVGVAILAGIIGFFILEKAIHWHHHHVDTEHHAANRAAGINNLIADGLHNFIDGLIIASAFLVDPAVGWATAVAVALHEIPQEIADFGVLLHAGFSRTQAIVWNFVSALTAVAGAGFGLILAERIESFAPLMVAYAAGAFIYIAMSDLIPTLHQHSNKKPGSQVLQVMTILLGMLLMLGLVQLENASGVHTHLESEQHEHTHADEEDHHEDDEHHDEDEDHDHEDQPAE